jgi:hypothetical protein
MRRKVSDSQETAEAEERNKQKRKGKKQFKGGDLSSFDVEDSSER